MVGEIGGNDYNAALHQDLPYDKLISIVPRVIHAISSTVTVTPATTLALTYIYYNQLDLPLIIRWKN